MNSLNAENSVSIIIPCRNEEKYIGKCLDSIIAQDYPKERMEVLVVDGASEDETRTVIKKFQIQNSKLKIQLIDNPRKFTPFGLNIGIRNTQGEIIIRMDAHSGYREDFISKCVSHLMESGADNVGGVIKTSSADDTLEARAVALSLSSPFGAASDFRLGGNKPKSVDTVFGGCFKKEIFERIGLFDERLIRSQDLEFNLRIKSRGGKIILFPDIVVYYYPQPTFLKFFKHNFNDGIWSIYPLKIIKMKFKLRHYIPLLFVAGLISSFILGIFSAFFFAISIFILFVYGFTTFYFSLKIALEEKDIRFLLLMPIAFFCRHFGYGLGSIFGVIKIIKD